MEKKRTQFSAKDKVKLVREVDNLRDAPSDVRYACDLAGINTTQYYRWRKQVARAEAGDKEALEPKSRRPKTYGNKSSDQTRKRVIWEAQSGHHRTANKLKEYLASCGVKISLPTVLKILKKAGLYGVEEIRDDEGRLIRKSRGLLNVKQ